MSRAGERYVARAWHRVMDLFLVVRRMAGIVESAQQEQLRFQRRNAVLHVERPEHLVIGVLRERAYAALTFEQSLAQARFYELHGTTLVRKPRVVKLGIVRSA